MVRRTFDQVDLQSATGKRLGTYTAPLQIDGGADGIVLKGRALNGRTSGAYRGILELRPGAFGVNAINAVPLDEYVQGVVPVESPASWPLEALKAQAVAARTYAITSTKGGIGFEQYPDTRSQVYGGIGRRAADDQPGRRGDRAPGRHLPGPPGHHLLLLHLGRAHGEQRELVRRAAAAVAALRRGPLRQRLAAPPLARAADDGRRPRASCPGS